MNIAKNIQNLIPDSRWKSRTNYDNMTVCYSGKCCDYTFKVVEYHNDRFDLTVKSNTKTYKNTYSDSNDLLDHLPAVLDDLDR